MVTILSAKRKLFRRVRNDEKWFKDRIEIQGREPGPKVHQYLGLPAREKLAAELLVAQVLADVLGVSLKRLRKHAPVFLAQEI